MQTNITGSSVLNPELKLANDFILHTNHNLFLTGKAGTGKTTFLHALKKNIPKRMIVTAPTGVAAINAGGVTLHSFFQMPFGPFVPDSEAYKQVQQRRFNKEKIEIIDNLDLLIIDEISMVRADLLDGIDVVLRRYRNKNLPFGGIQLLMIGDLHQLSPVARDEEWNILKEHYDSCYFFSSKVFQQAQVMSVELQYIYRQSDARFINLLNCIRDNNLNKQTMEMLNSRVAKNKDKDLTLDVIKNCITLTTHNFSADKINQSQLQSIKDKTFNYQATVENIYPEHNYPTAAELYLKKGSQVMFVRNDMSPSKQYFNGKIGKITAISEDEITVKCSNNEPDIVVKKTIWNNIKYTVEQNNGHTNKKISEEIIGRFIQFPLRLAWAITIHKSQGLTFEQVIIDAAAAFSHGQIYVALSRCKTLEGIMLSTSIPPNAIKTDLTVKQFVAKISKMQTTEIQLDQAKILYQEKLLQECFDCQELYYNTKKLIDLLRINRRIVQFSAAKTLEYIEEVVFKKIVEVSENFNLQLLFLFNKNNKKNNNKNIEFPENNLYIQQRVQKAACYFVDKLETVLLNWIRSINIDTDNKEVQRKLIKAIELLQRTLSRKIAGMYSCQKLFSITSYLKAIANAKNKFVNNFLQNKQKTFDISVEIEHPRLLQELKKWRTNRASEEKVDNYKIIHQKVLISLVTVRPSSIQNLINIKGIGKYKAKKYGEQLIEIIAVYCKKNNIKPDNMSNISSISNRSTYKNIKQEINTENQAS